MVSSSRCRLSTCAAFATAALSACATSYVPDLSPKEVEGLTTAQRGRLSVMKVYRSYENPPDQPHKVVASVKGISCHRNTYVYKQVTDEEAIYALKVRAALLNADAVFNLDCQASSGTDWVNNCWSSIVCVGDAIQSYARPDAAALLEPLITPSGAIAVVPSTIAPSLEYLPLPPPKEPAGLRDKTGQALAQGAAKGAVAGAATGAAAGLVVAIDVAISTAGIGIVILPYSVAVGTAVGAVGGGALGAAGAVSENRPRPAPIPSRDTLTPIPVHLPVAEAMVAAAEIEPQLQVRLPVPLLGTRCPVFRLQTEQGIASNVTTAASIDVENLKAQGYSGCLEVGITHLRWDERRDQTGPYLVSLATARARMEDFASKKTVVTRDFWFQSSRRYSSQPLTSALKRAQAALGERMAEDMVINAIGNNVIENGICGLAPAQTRFHDPDATASGQDTPRQPPATYLNPQDPVLAWESFPTQRHLAVLSREAEGSPTDVAYDLRIWREGEEGYVYERAGLSGSTYRIDPLLPPGEYRWSARARFVYAGRPRATTWNYAWEPAMADASANIKPPQGGWVTCRRDFISDASSFRLIVPSR